VGTWNGQCEKNVAKRAYRTVGIRRDKASRKSANHPFAKLGSSEVKGVETMQAEKPVVDPEEWPEAVDLIFITEFGRPVNVNSLIYKHFKPILKRAGLPNIRLYDLRHTAATLALAVGVSPKVVSEQLGHSSAAFTLDVYSHVLPHMQDDAAAKVEAVLMAPSKV